MAMNLARTHQLARLVLKLDRPRQDLVVGALACNWSGKRHANKSDEQKTRQGPHQNLHLSLPTNTVGEAARRKSRRSGRDLASTAARHRPNALRQWAFRH